MIFFWHFLIIASIAYFIHSFSEWEFHPGNWSRDDREGVMIVFFMLYIITIVFVIGYYLKEI